MREGVLSSSLSLSPPFHPFARPLVLVLCDLPSSRVPSLFILLSPSLAMSFFTSRRFTRPITRVLSVPPIGSFFYFLSLDPYDPCVQRDHVFKVLRSNKQRTGAIRLLFSLSISFLLSLPSLSLSLALFSPLLPSSSFLAHFIPTDSS